MRCPALLTRDLDGWVDEDSLITAPVTQTLRPYAVDQFQYLGAVAVEFRSPHAVDSGQCLQAGWLSSRDGPQGRVGKDYKSGDVFSFALRCAPRTQFFEQLRVKIDGATGAVPLCTIGRCEWLLAGRAAPRFAMSSRGGTRATCRMVGRQKRIQITRRIAVGPLRSCFAGRRP